jgi:hypothetical protein
MHPIIYLAKWIHGFLRNGRQLVSPVEAVLGDRGSLDHKSD